jgi:transcriptional regulator with XRE-family HTH domain
MSKSPIVARINALLSLRGISKKQFFKDCKISSSAFSQWNTGKIEVPRGKNIERIANYLDVSVEYLLYGDTQEFQAKKERPTDGEALISELPEDIQKLIRICELNPDLAAALLSVAQQIEKGQVAGE